MRVNWDLIESTEGYALLPVGDYVARITDVRTDRTTKKGDEAWGICWTISEGPLSGRIVWDNLYFNEGGLKRIKLLCARMGLPTAGEVDLSPEDLKDKRVVINVEIEEYPLGSGKKRNVIPFGGIAEYKPAGGGVVKAPKTTKEAVAHNFGGPAAAEEETMLPF